MNTSLKKMTLQRNSMEIMKKDQAIFLKIILSFQLLEENYWRKIQNFMKFF